MRLLIRILSGLFFPFFLLGQTEQITAPHSWQHNLQITEVFVETAIVNVEQELRQDSISELNHSFGARRFGVEQEVSIDVFLSGEVTELSNGDRITQLQIRCPDAISIHLLFNDFYLSEGVQVSLFKIDKSSFIGAYSTSNNNSENVLGTELLKTDRLVLEVFEPAAEIGKSNLNIGTIVHGYRDIDALFEEEMNRNLNGSGNCNIDVNCPQGEGWEQQRNSVARIVMGGSYCSGSLVNNTSDEIIPYLLTANHCLFNAPSAGVWVYRFRWEAPYQGVSCATTSPSEDGPTQYSINGSEIKASNSNADFLLLELFNAPEITWGIYYNGWDWSDAETVTRVTSIHHPRGDLKKIAHAEIAPTKQSIQFNGDPNTRIWRVESWTEGVTEQASSGAPLFDQDKRVIGVLSGGSAACAGTINNGGYDVFGRFGIAWDEKEEEENQLNHWLDPVGSNETKLDGVDPNFAEFDVDVELLGIERLDGVACGDSTFPKITFVNRGKDPLTSLQIKSIYNNQNPIIGEWNGFLETGFSAEFWLTPMATQVGENLVAVELLNPNDQLDENPAQNSKNLVYFSAKDGEYVSLELNLDCFPEETSWHIEDLEGNIWYNNEPYVSLGNASQLISEAFCLAEGCYSFTIEDREGDGFAGSQKDNCNFDGSVRLMRSNNQEELFFLLEENANFGTSISFEFCALNAASTLPSKKEFSSFRIFPNPSSGQVTMELFSAPVHESYQVKVFDIQGRKVDAFQMNKNQKKQVFQLAFKGVYFVHVSNGELNEVKRLVIQ